jgi:hypothetical protein
MKTLFTFLVLIFFFTNAQAQNIDATLGGNTSAEGFSVKNAGGTTLLRVGGDGNIGMGNFGNGDINLTIRSIGGNTARNGIRFRNFNEDYGWTIQNDERLVSDGLNFLSHFNDPDGVSRLFLGKFGNVGIGTTSPNYALDVRSNNANNFAASISNTSTSGYGLSIIVGSSGSGFEKAFNISSVFPSIFNVEAGGVVSGNYGTYHAPSDLRLKKEIVTIPDALAKVMKLRGVNFKWKDSERGQSLQMGFIAQEVEKIVPEVVHTADDEMQTKSVEYQYLVGLLVEAVKDQQKQIEVLESKINSIASKEIDGESFGYIKTNGNKLKNYYSVKR